MFKKAERKKAKLRLALSGPSGSGKTTGALLIARGIGGRIAVLDTERGSASLYADIVGFDVVELGPPYTPEEYIKVIYAAEKHGYDTLILDSITHEWNGSGGMLEIVESIARSRYRGNSYAAWNEGTPRHRKFVDAMLASSMHIIATMRSKTVYVETEKPNGKKSIEKQGAAPQQRDGLEYEFTAVLDLSVDGNFANASKDRTRLFRDPFVITENTGRTLREWLESGVGSSTLQEPPLPQRRQSANQNGQQQRPPATSPTQEQQPPPPADDASQAQPSAPHVSLEEAQWQYVSLEEAQWQFTTSNSVEALRATAKQLNIRKENPEYEAIHAAYTKRYMDLTGAAPGQNGATTAAASGSGKLTAGQRTGIMAYFSKRGLAADDKRAARLKELSDFCQRDVTSVNALTFEEASDFLSAINANREEDA